MKPFYITTPIYYVNDKPHIGHAYSTIAADVMCRYQRLRGRPARFLTGTDEHGQKIERRAAEEGIAPQAFVDRMAPPFREAFDELGCAYDDFIRTTEERHESCVKRLWSRLEKAGDIYLGEYEDWYCVGCESFKTDKELLEGNICPLHKKPVERVKEQSYFFRLSKYTEPLLAYYAAHPRFVQPEGRFNEVKSFVREGLRDLSISRTSFRWGVPVPGDDAHVMYVWLDALTNYISALGGLAQDADADAAPLFDRFWPPQGEAIHIVGKDILRFHAVYWPAFLLSAGVEPPTQVWAHGWLTVDGEKMSKGLGNFIPPGPLVRELGADVLRYYLMREVAFGQDGDFSHANLLARYHGDLGNGLGNLLNRMVASIVKKNLGGVVPTVDEAAMTALDRELVETAKRTAASVAEHLERLAPHRALEVTWELVGAANRYVDQTAPWALAKQGDEARLAVVAYTVLESLRWLGLMLWPFMPERSQALHAQLGLGDVEPAVGIDGWPAAWGGLVGGSATAPGEPLFPRLDEKRQAEMMERLVPRASDPAPSAKGEGSSTVDDKTALSKGAAKSLAKGVAKGAAQGAASTPASDGAAGDLIAFDDFLKVDLRLALIKSAEAVPKSDKLVKLIVDLGAAGERQILAGIRLHYAPEELVGRRVVIVANLAPRKIMGQPSEGMVLAVSDETGLSVLGVDKEIEPGCRVS
jgi:methionyl-tRNA synthetase